MLLRNKTPLRDRGRSPSQHCLRRLLPMTLSTSLGLSAAGIGPMVMAQSVSESTQNFQIASGSLDAALVQFGQQSGVMASVSGSISGDKQVSGFTGNYSVADALNRLLQDTGLAPVEQANGSYIIVAQPSERGATSVMTLNAIKVSGEKIERSLQDTVSSVSVLTEAQMDGSAIYDLQDAFSRMPNVNPALAGEGLTIRGINHFSVTGNSGSLGTGELINVNLDGAFMPRRAIEVGQNELWDVAQVEVFRGAQSTNTGRNSLGGAVFMQSNDPTYDHEGQYRLFYG